MGKAIDQAVQKTVNYGKKYGAEYSAEEIEERLISRNVFDLKELRGVLARLPLQNKDHKLRNISEEKIDKAKKLARELGSKFSEILFVGVTGSVAAGYPEVNDDIDLMVVTKKDNLWMTRFKVRSWIWYKGIPHRQFGKVERRDQFCFNLWLDEDALELPKNKQNLKNAMDLILMKVIYNQSATYQRLIKENNWAREHVATGYLKKISNYKFHITNKNERKNYWDKIVNWLAFWLQFLYMKPKIGGGLIDQKRAFFHPDDQK